MQLIQIKYRYWEEIGKPEYLKPNQIAKLKAAGAIIPNNISFTTMTDDCIQLIFDIPPQSVVNIVLIENDN